MSALITPATSFEGFVAAMMERRVRPDVALVDPAVAVAVAAAQAAIAARFGIQVFPPGT